MGHVDVGNRLHRVGNRHRAFSVIERHAVCNVDIRRRSKVVNGNDLILAIVNQQQVGAGVRRPDVNILLAAQRMQIVVIHVVVLNESFLDAILRNRSHFWIFLERVNRKKRNKKGTKKTARKKNRRKKPPKAQTSWQSPAKQNFQTNVLHKDKNNCLPFASIFCLPTTALAATYRLAFLVAWYRVNPT
jgi:hypothetical protein